MANQTTKKTTAATTKSTAPKVTNIEDKVESQSEKRIAELEALVKQLLDNQTQSSNISTADNTDEEIIINPNKKTKITSLTFGTLTLYCTSRGFLRFSDFGVTHTLTYAQLCDYINNCRNAAQEGNFYIHNQQMVEDLGLSEHYEKIISNSIVNNIIKSENLDYEDILSKVTETQRKNLGEIFTDKTYNQELTDIRKIDKISKSLNIDIMKKIEEMKQVAELSKKE